MTSLAWILLLQLVAAADAAEPWEAHGSIGLAAPDGADSAPEPPAEKPKEEPPPPKAPAPSPTPAPPKGKAPPSCRLPSEEGPRGGRLVVEGAGFGRTPLVRIGDRVTRILSRLEHAVAVQIPADSDGGPVTLEAGGVRAACGWLTIVGKHR